MKIAVDSKTSTSCCQRRSLVQMFTWFLYALMCVAATGQRRSRFGVRRWSLASTVGGPGCAVVGGGLENRDCCPQNITTANDYGLIPRNLTHVHLIFSYSHRVEFGRGTLPQQLGGPRLVRLLMSVRYAPHRRLPTGFFVNLARLRSVQLYHDAPSSNHFSLRLSEGTFDGLSEVVELQLAQLGIEHLPAGVFRGLYSICRLDLSQNRLAVIRSDIFQPQPISTPTGSTENHCCRNLTVLSLGRNRFVDVVDIQLSGLTSLRSVDLYENAITKLDRDSFGGRTNSSSGGFANVEQLNLGHNVIDHIGDSAFERLTRLRVLYLDENMIRNVSSSAFIGLSVVEEMDLSGNSMSELPSGVFVPLTSLRILYLATNVIETVQTGAFFGLGKLQSLDLSSNRLRSLGSGTLYGLGSLQQLFVRGNQLVEVSPRALDPVAGVLTDLDLADNRLQTIDFQTLAKVDRLMWVDLSSNPWTCDCRMWWLDDRGSEYLKAAWDNIVCELPPAARGKLLSSVLDQNSTVICSNRLPPSTEQPTLPPFNVVDRWSTFAWMAVAVVLVLGVVVATGLMASVYRSRRSASWSPCDDKVDAAGSSETSRTDDGDRKTDDVEDEICDQHTCVITVNSATTETSDQSNMKLQQSSLELQQG